MYNVTDKPVKSKMLIHTACHRHIVAVSVSCWVTALYPWKECKYYTVVRTQKMNLRILENKNAETATQNSTIKFVLYNN